MVTGKHELDVKDLKEKLGSIADSTKVCGTGTCKSYDSQKINTSLIPDNRDNLDAFKILKTVGDITEDPI